MMPRVALVARPEDADDRILVGRFRGLLEQGWDAHLLCDGGDPGRWEALELLPGHVLRERVHPPPRDHRRRLAPRGPFVRALGRTVARRPGAAARTLIGGGRTDRRRLGDRYVAAVLLALRPRLVHFHSTTSALSRLGVRDALGCRVVVSPGPGERLDAETRQALAGVEMVPAGRAPVDLRFFEPAHAARRRGREGPLRVLCAGDLTWRQGHEFAVCAVRELLDRDVRCELQIVGDGEQAAALGFTRYRLRLERHVALRGALSPERLRDAMRDTDVFLSCALADDGSTPVHEAQAAGLPVVATDRAGLAHDELERTGLPVPPRDPRATADALERMAGDRALRERLGEAGREAMAARNGRADGGEETERLYRSVLELG